MGRIPEPAFWQPTVDTFKLLAGFGLQGDAAPHLGAIPFRTTLIHWEVGPGTGEVELTDEILEATYKELTTEIRELMETLRGEQAC